MPNIMGLQNMAHEMGRKVPRQMQGYGEKLKKFTKLMEKIELNCEAKERLTNHAIYEISHCVITAPGPSSLVRASRNL